MFRKVHLTELFNFKTFTQSNHDLLLEKLSHVLHSLRNSQVLYWDQNSKIRFSKIEVFDITNFAFMLKVSRSRRMKQKVYEILTSSKIQTNNVILNNCIDKVCLCFDRLLLLELSAVQVLHTQRLMPKIDCAVYSGHFFQFVYSVVSIKRTGCNKRTRWSKIFFST